LGEDQDIGVFGENTFQDKTPLSWHNPKAVKATVAVKIGE
jgi:hypothetical protein